MKKLAIILGHNPERRGAVRDGLTEFEYNLDVQGIMLARAHEFGMEAKGFWRKNNPINQWDEIREAYTRVVQWRPDAVMELHFNAFTNSQANGCEVLWAENPFANDLADCVLVAINSMFDVHVRGARQLKMGDRGYESVTQLFTPIVLCEPFFATNDRDWEKFVEDPKGVGRLAEAYLKGVERYFKEKQMIDDSLIQKYFGWEEDKDGLLARDMVRRHPHIFQGTGYVSWGEAKRRERDE